MAPDGRVMATEVRTATRAATSEPRVLFSVPGNRMAIFEDRGVGFFVIGDGERFFVRQSAAGLSLRLVRPWSLLLRRADTARVTIRP